MVLEPALARRRSHVSSLKCPAVAPRTTATFREGRSPYHRTYRNRRGDAAFVRGNPAACSFSPRRVFFAPFRNLYFVCRPDREDGRGNSPRHCYVYTRKRGARHNTSQIQEQAVPSNICFQIVLFSRRISNLSCLSDVGLFFRVVERNRTTLIVSEMVMYCGSFVISKVRTEVGEQIDA